MGILALEPHSRLAAPDSPPELVSPTSSTYSSRPSPPADAHWTFAAPVSPPMSNYDSNNSAADVSTVGKSMDERRNPKDAAPSVPRQQLPSLSSLFGPPASVRPLHSPLSDRPGSYLATSPLDRPRVSSAHGERSHSSSYFSQAISPPVTQPRSTYETKVDHDRSSIHALSRSFSGSGSPRFRESDGQRQEPRSDGGYGPSKWLAHHDSGRHEYSLGGRESSGPLRSPHDRLPFHFPSAKDAVQPYRDQRPMSGPGLAQPPTPTSTVVSEGIPAKDGLGPKIWTGTHFLPRFVRAAEVPGEGMCYFYDDGSHCKTVIDGEAVNAHWGVTKAGKPRKRLAIACITCREKKIKCDPDYPRCVQCEKFGRVCKFKNAPRGGHNTSPSTPPAEVDDLRRLGGPSKPNELHRPSSNSSSSVSPRTSMRQPSLEPPIPHKRMRLGYENYSSVTGEPSRMVHTPETAKTSLSWHHHPAIELPRIHEDVLNRAWQTDPYVSDPQSISTVISSFFVHVDSTMALRFLPEKPFKSWVAGNAHRKSPEDLMLVYSILAVGVILSGGPKNIAHEYAQVARFAQQRAAFGLQLVQTRLLLAVYYLSYFNPCDSNDMCSAAISSAACLQLNLELDNSNESNLTIFPYGLDRAGYAETRRRTFWACFALERLSGIFPMRPAILNTEDIFLQLPSDSQSFEDQRDTVCPRFGSNCIAAPKATESSLSTLSYFVRMVDIWANIMSNSFRNANRPPDAQFDEPQFLDRTLKILEDWQGTLPQRLIYSAGNMERAIVDGNLGSFLKMHLLYHHAMIKLHRHIRSPQKLSPSLKLEHLFRINDHATRILDITGAMDLLFSARHAQMTAPPLIASLAVLEATDVLTAEGSLFDVSVLFDRLVVAKRIVETTGNVWEAANSHRRAIEHRLEKLLRVRERGAATSSPSVGVRIFNNEESKESRLPAGLCWQFSESLETGLPRKLDLIYTNLTQLPLYG